MIKVAYMDGQMLADSAIVVLINNLEKNLQHNIVVVVVSQVWSLIIVSKLFLRFVLILLRYSDQMK
jgi:hypothetical protein